MCCATKHLLMLKGVSVAKDVAGAVSLKVGLVNNHRLEWKPSQPLQISEAFLYATRRPGHEPSKRWIRYPMTESMYFVQITWTWHGTDDFLELMLSKELEGLAAL
jgi:hypothetical protein